MSENNDAPLVGRIIPDVRGGAPQFVILRRDEARYRTDDELAGVRPCDHPRFILDAKWNTVTCGKCKERLDPFAALLRYAEIQERLDLHRELHNQAAVRNYVAIIRREMRRVTITPEERAEAEAIIRRHTYGSDVEPVKACADKLEKANRERRHDRRWGNRGGAA